MKSTVEALMIAIAFIEASGNMEYFEKMLKTKIEMSPDAKNILDIAMLVVEQKSEEELEGNLI